MRLSSSIKGTLFIDSYRDNRIQFMDGKGQNPTPLGKEVNSGGFIAHPFIAPDESYLLWDCVREGGFGDSDIYVSFRSKDGEWGPAVNLGSGVNTGREEFFASITPDGKFLFFTRVQSETKANIYWVDAAIVERLRPK